MKVYCVMVETIIQMCYEIEELDRIFKTKETAETYVKECAENSLSPRTIVEMELE